MRFKLRLEPYDPDARDADGDGLVQEGTAWERPAGSKIVDELGKEIKRGLTSPYRNTRFKIVDKDGNNLDYQPTYGKDADFDPKDEKPTLEKLGYRSIEQMGLPTVADMVLPSTKPQGTPPGETPVEEIAPEPEVPMVPVESTPEVPKPRYPRQPPAHAMTGLAEKTFGKAETWEEFREILAETDIVFLDYETTGLVFDEFGRASSNGKPTQIGAVRMRDGKVIERFNVFVNPGIPMSEWEQWSRDNLVDGDGNPLTDEFFDDKPSIADAHRQLLDFIGEGTILGMQNAVFDDAVLAEALRESGIDWKPEGIIDTKEMSSMALPRWTPENPDGPSRVDSRTGETVPSNGLADITKYLGVDLGDKHHSADYDAEATGNVLTAIVDGAIEKRWSKDFLDKEKRDEKIRLNDEKFAKEIEQFERDKAAWEASQAVPEVSRPIEEPEPQNADEAVRRFLQQVETGSLPYQLDENEIAEEIFQIRESYAEETDGKTDAIIAIQPSLTADQEQAIREVSDLLGIMRQLGVSISEEEFFARYSPDEQSVDLVGIADPWSLAGIEGAIVRLLPRSVVARDGSEYGIRPTQNSVYPGSIYLEGIIVNAQGREIASYSRHLDFDDQKNLVATHDYLEVSVDYRNLGIGSAFNRDLEKIYRRLGVDRIELGSMSDIRYEGDERTPMDVQRGVSFWPRQGFDWTHPDDLREVSRMFRYLFTGDTDQPDPESVYIQGVSDGAPPVGAERFYIAYFASQEEWQSFALAVQRIRTADFNDPNRPVAGDVMRWAGADEWVAYNKGEYAPDYVKRLNPPSDEPDHESTIDQVIADRRALSAEREKAINTVSKVFAESINSQSSIPRDLDFLSVSSDTAEQLAEEGVDLDQATKFGLQMIKMFEFDAQTRDGSSISIRADEITTNFSGGKRAFYVTGSVYEAGQRIANFQRTIRAVKNDDGSITLYVEHDSLTVKDSHQGRGVGTVLNTELERIYRKMGISHVETNAVSGGGQFGNRYIGATHWPRAGFDWADEFAKSEYIRVLNYLMEPDPESEEMMPSTMAYVEGLSSGPRPTGSDRRRIAYFASVEEWENFVEMMDQARAESLDDENRVVAGDLVRWDGADDYFAGGEFSFDLIKRLIEE